VQRRDALETTLASHKGLARWSPSAGLVYEPDEQTGVLRCKNDAKKKKEKEIN